MSDWRDPSYSEKAISAFSFRVHRRLQAAGASQFDVEDIRQEMWLHWCKVVKSYDPEKGVPFLAFLRRCMQQEANKVIKARVEHQIDTIGALSLDFEQESDEDSPSFGACVADPDAVDPATVAEERSTLDAVLRRLSPAAQAYVQMLLDPPPELVEDFARLRHKEEQARRMGLPFARPRALTSAMVFNLMGVSGVQRARINKELSKVIERINR